MDCDFEVSEDGEKAIAFIEAIDKTDSRNIIPHIVLLDLNLPRKGEGRVLGESGKAPNAARVPVVIVTSSDSPR